MRSCKFSSTFETLVSQKYSDTTGANLTDVPEFFEVDLGEALISRTETLASFRELGPPDLCHIIKSTGTGTSLKEVSPSSSRLRRLQRLIERRVVK